MDEVRLTTYDLIFYMEIVNILLGLLFGSFPLIVGLRYGLRKHAILGFLFSLIGGAVAGIILAYPVAAIVTWIIVSRATAPIKPSGDTTAANP